MPHTLPPLPYATSALEPHIDAQTMEIHHGKHHAAYVTNLNAALDKAPELKDKPVDLMIVIGGYNSSNTANLARICAAERPTFHIAHRPRAAARERHGPLAPAVESAE